MACIVVKYILVSIISCICLGVVYGAAGNCNNPGLWCSSVEVARECKVLKQCMNEVWNGKLPETDNRVNVALYYETLCPDCKDIFRDQVFETFQKLSGIMNLQLVPYGNADEMQHGDEWKFTCQHGPSECLGNLIQTCALHLLDDLNISMPFIACMEYSDLGPNVTGPACAKKFQIDFSAISACVGSPLGNKLQHDMAVLTDQLDPPHTFVPWVTLNGEHTDDIQQKAETDLVKLICDTYTGPKPDACKSRPSPPRRCLKNQRNFLNFFSQFRGNRRL